MVQQEPLLVTLVGLVERIPVPAEPRVRGRGRPRFYSDRLFLKALVIMIVRRLHKVHELLSVLEEPTPEMQTLRGLLQEGARYPSRRTWERRLEALPSRLPAQIGCLGRHLIGLLVAQVGLFAGRAAALDSTPLRARGGVWHKKDREAGEVPHTAIDTEAGWTKSGWHGWVYGWKLHLAGLAVSEPAVWVPLAAELTPANVADSEVAPQLVGELPSVEFIRFLLGDRHYNTPQLREVSHRHGRILVTSQYGKYPHEGAGVEVRRVFHKLRSIAMENFNQHFKGIFDVHQQVPTKGLCKTQRFALGAVLVYQIALLQRIRTNQPLNVGLKPYLRAA